ncbi:aspartate/glutamate racemase family protein [Octadecabacter sp. G9-8]|uniref:Aspartate/glutamate racemase family protein n=1 Tax=Octadecabacter dasysiphoniae TaxID=2909341 RepID=A0ABS9CVX1_9RHOB|nr:aspartate/glutamate racemase family protein [Octadecabacter dasysiphoniae]MCF2870937.1 aspartate/glutamate racemase family protein [Octadecabacter dasysiphoniae]
MNNPLIIINPNSSETVTAGIDAAVDPLRGFGVPIKCLTLAAGPKGIESQMQADLTIAPMLELADAQTDAAGFVIACFGDPGLHALRDQTDKPVVGIQEASVMTALTLGQRFGVIAIMPGSIPRHLRSFGAMGVLDRLAGDRALGLGVADLASADKSLAAMIRTGNQLRDIDGANVLIMGCAGMAQYRAQIEGATGLPVVEPCQAAAAMALSHIALGQSHRKTKHAE